MISVEEKNGRKQKKNTNNKLNLPAAAYVNILEMFPSVCPHTHWPSAPEPCPQEMQNTPQQR